MIRQTFIIAILSFSSLGLLALVPCFLSLRHRYYTYYDFNLTQSHLALCPSVFSNYP